MRFISECSFIILLCLSTFFSPALGQEIKREFLNTKAEHCKKGDAVMIRIVTKESEGVFVEELIYKETKRPMAETTYSSADLKVKNGSYKRYKTEYWRDKKTVVSQPYEITGFFKNDLKDSTWVTLNRYGRDTAFIKTYKRDTLNGTYKKITNGTLRISGSYLVGLEQGYWEYRNRRGSLIKQGTYNQGVQDGKWLIHVGDTRIEGVYADGEKVGEWTAKYRNGRTKRFCNYKQGEYDGAYMAWYEDGTMRDSGLYVNGKKEGEWKYYFEDGRLSQYALYSDGQTDSSQYCNKAGELIPKGQEIYWQDASFPGGEMAMFQFVSENVAYPQEAVENGIQGIVYVQFMVGLDGDLSEIKVLKSPDVLLSNEAIRVIERMPPWIPGKEHTQVKSLLFTLPIHFRLG